MNVNGNNQPIRLVNPIQIEVVSFLQGLQAAPTFSKEYQHLEEAMKTVGIPIPLDQRTSYELKAGQLAIHLGEKGFGKAFYEIYFKEKMDPAKFKWEPIIPKKNP